MAKETFYFSHDYNARADRKMVLLSMKYGMSGIGVYWCLIEMLYEDGGYLPLEYERITYELRTEKNVIQSVLNDFELFENDGEKFWSNSVLERLEKRKEKSVKATESINKRWNNTNVIRTNKERNTIKERKGKESKGNVSTEPNNELLNSNLFRKPNIPTFDKVHEVFLNHGGTKEMAEKFYATNSATEWFYRGSPIKTFSSLVPSFIQAWKKSDGTLPVDKKLQL